MPGLPSKPAGLMPDQPTLNAIPKCPLSSRLSIQRDAVFTLLRQLAVDNEVYFRQCNPSVYNTRMSDSCEEIATSIDLIKDLIKQLLNISHKCDYDENTPGNGFRSLMCVSDIVILHLISVLRICSENRGVMMFRLSHYCKELESFAAILRFLILALQQVTSMLDILEDNSLFPTLEGDYQKYNGLLKSIESLDATCFYGRPLGFQFSPSVTRIFRVIGLVLATYSLSWETKTATLGSLISSGKLLLNPEQRAKRIIKITREADIGFCRGFWNLSELPVPKLFCPSMAVCENREIQPAGPLPMKTNNGATILIEEPSAHTGVRPVAIKILSFSHRIGLSTPNHVACLPLSPYLVIHCHGGGYVATSSKSHETYLRSWAKALNCPLVSIDYSLAPENPYPRPTEEVLYAYAWILNNPDKFGWTGEKVCMVGDSAGGNLITSVCLRLIELNIKRLPDGIVPIYTPFLFQYLPSPSRVLSFMDPLLHMGVVIRCAAAYTGSSSDAELDKNCTYRDTSTTSANGHKSLVEYVDQVQKAQCDNFLDFTQGSQSIVSLINLSFFNKTNPTIENSGTSDNGLISNNNRQGPSRLNEQDGPTENDTSLTNSSTSGSNVSGQEQQRTTDEQKAAAIQQIEEAAEAEAEEDAETDRTIQTVQINADPFHIHLSATNFDQHLIDYLQMHPITKSSVQSMDGIGEAAEEVHPTTDVDMEEVFDDALTTKDNAAMPSAPAMPKSATVGSISQNPPPLTPASAKSRRLRDPFVTPDATVNGNKSRLLSSAGRTPYYPSSKTPLSRNKCRSFSQSLADTAVLAAGHAFDNITDWFDAPKEPMGYSDKKKLTRATTMSAQKAAQLQREEAETHESHFTELLKLNLPREPQISPMYAPAEALRKLPPIRFVACHLDPLLDDTVTFAKRVRQAGGCVAGIDLLDSLPHGFLNFAPMSADCRDGANLCLERIKQTLGM